MCSGGEGGAPSSPCAPSARPATITGKLCAHELDRRVDSQRPVAREHHHAHLPTTHTRRSSRRERHQGRRGPAPKEPALPASTAVTLSFRGLFRPPQRPSISTSSPAIDDAPAEL